jgi:hypothetical protein
VLPISSVLSLEKEKAYTFVAGRRVAKLNITLATVYFIALFDFELSDEHGNASAEIPRLTSRDEETAQKPNTPAYLRYKQRA